MADKIEIRRTLENRLRLLASRVAEIDGDLREHDEDDIEERAVEIAGDEVLEGLGRASLQEINEIRAALLRLDRGTYGRCTRCGSRIDKRRLEALPQAAFCLECVSASTP